MHPVACLSLSVYYVDTYSSSNAEFPRITKRNPRYYRTKSYPSLFLLARNTTNMLFFLKEVSLLFSEPRQHLQRPSGKC